MTNGKTQEAAAAAAGMSVRTAREWQEGPLPSQTKQERRWRTREDPFEEVWAVKIEPLLVRDGKGELEAKTLMQLLVDADPQRFSMGQLRTMQRRIRDWRALRGPDKEVYFEQRHEPGDESALDFTCGNELEVTIAGLPFRHLLFELVMVWSTWTWTSLAFSESFEALVDGLQRALWALGGVPRRLILDNMSAATHELRKDGGRALNKRFGDVCDHLGLERVRRINVRKAHENGACEVRHGRTKKHLAQALVLRGSRDFASEELYERFVQQTLQHAHNRHVEERLAEERARLRPLPALPVPTYTTTTPTVRRWSTISVCSRIYSVPSRLIGHCIEARLYSNKLELRHRGQVIDVYPRLRGNRLHRIDYRHVIKSLVRKPGAFAQYRFREELFPTLSFRRAYDALLATHGERADVEYVRILNLAAETMECRVEAELIRLLDTNERIDYRRMAEALQPRESAVPVLSIPSPDLSVYDALLGGAP